MGFIYKISNNVNDKVYIGQTQRTLEERWNEHLKNVKYNKIQTKLYLAIREIGIEHFSFEAIESCDTEEELNQQEKY